MKKEILAFYERDTHKRHRYQIYTQDDSVAGMIYLMKGRDIPEKLIIELKAKEGNHD